MLKSILLFYKDLLKIESCILGAIFKQKLSKISVEFGLKVYNNDFYEFFTLRTLSVCHLCTFVFCDEMVKNLNILDKIT